MCTRSGGGNVGVWEIKRRGSKIMRDGKIIVEESEERLTGVVTLM